MATGLYELTGGRKNGEMFSDDLSRIIKENHFSQNDRERLLLWLEELKFWEDYSIIYPNLEKAKPYTNLSKSIFKMLEPKENEKWLDVGCGPLRVSELIWKKSDGKVGSIEAIDIILKPAQDKLTKLTKQGIYLPIRARYASITDSLPYPDNYFDGIGANLVLPYVVDFVGQKGRDAFEGVLREMFRVLKPGGHMVWTTPVHGVKFFLVFVASLPDMLNIYEYIAHKDITRIQQGTRILKHALAIQNKGKSGIYTFLQKNELQALLRKIGFTAFAWERTFAQQTWVNRVYKN